MRRSISAKAAPSPSVAGDLGPHGFQGGELFAAGVVDPEPGQLVGEVVVAGERRGEDDPGAVADVVGEHPPVGQLAADAGRPVVTDEWDAGVAQRVDAGAHRELGLRARGRGSARRRRRTPRRRSNSPARPASLITSAGLSIVSKRAPDSPFTRRVMCLPSDLVADPRRDDVDPLLAVQDAGDVGVVEHAAAPRAARGRRR